MKVCSQFIYALIIVLRKKYRLLSTEVSDFFEDFKKSSLYIKQKERQKRRETTTKTKRKQAVNDRHIDNDIASQIINEMSNDAIENPRHMIREQQQAMNTPLRLPGDLDLNSESTNSKLLLQSEENSQRFKEELIKSSKRNLEELNQNIQ